MAFSHPVVLAAGVLYEPGSSQDPALANASNIGLALTLSYEPP